MSATKVSSLTTKVLIHETFQCTIQGEGYWTGTLVDFIRFYGCPVGCSWCDTGYSALTDQAKLPQQHRTIQSLVDELQSPRVVISGGEPFMQPLLVNLCNALLADHDVSIETSGIRWLDIHDDVWVTLSPKEHVRGSKVDETFWCRANEIKIVVETGNELEYYREHLLKKSCNTPIYLQPEWSRRGDIIPKILEMIKAHPTARLSLQTHKLIGVQ